ncbi:MAG: lipopolysaccharide biosynthesis protein [bacterium]
MPLTPIPRLAFPKGRLSRKAMWVGSGRGIQFLAQILGAIYLARRFSDKADFGLYQQAWLLLNTSLALLQLGIPQALNVYLSKHDESEGPRLAWVMQWLLLALGAMAAILFRAGAAPVSGLVANPQIASLAPWLGVYLFFALPATSLDALLIQKDRPRLLCLTAAATGIVFFALHLVFAEPWELTSLFESLCILQAARLGVTLVVLTQGYGWPKRVWSRKRIEALSPYLGVLGLIAVVDVVSVQLDKFIVSRYFSAADFAIYSIGAIEVPFVGILLAAVTATLLPELSRLHGEGKSEACFEMLQSSMRKLGLILWPGFLFLLVFADPLIPLVFKESYSESVAVFRIYLFLLPLRVLNNHPLLLATGLQRYALYGRIIDTMANLALALALMPFIGLWGPAVATVAATYIHKTYQTVMIMKALGKRLTELYPWATLVRQFAGVAAAVAGAGAVKLLVNGGLAQLAIGIVIFLVLFPLLNWRALKQEL